MRNEIHEILDGDATCPNIDPTAHNCIIHICNVQGFWGAGFAKSLNVKWKQPRREYIKMKHLLELGDIQVIAVDDSISVINMIAQDGINSKWYDGGTKKTRVDYAALEKCLQNVKKHYAVVQGRICVHMPQIGAGLAGGNWQEIKKLIQRVFIDDCDQNMTIFIYYKTRK